SAQINGEFWWLNEKVTKLLNIEPVQPAFDDVSEFDTDESAKVIFQENYLDNSKSESRDVNGAEQLKIENMPTAIFFKDDSVLTRPVNENLAFEELANTEINSNDKMSITQSEKTANNEDILDFVFPDEKEIITKHIRNGTNSTDSLIINKTVISTTNRPPAIILKNTNKLYESESICTFVSKFRCFERRGVPYIFPGRSSEANQAICCILPIKSNKASQFLFPDAIEQHKRFKRSGNESENLSPAIKQRNALLRRKYEPNNSYIKMSTTTPRTILAQKVVTSEDDLDPYWNVKNSKFRNPSSFAQSSATQDDYNYKDYIDYAYEIPKPGGLVGLYSDHDNRGWSFVKPNKGFTYNDPVDADDEEEDENISFGYSTIDPRFGNKAGSTSLRRKPSHLIDSSPEEIRTSESHAISFRSKPDFEVLRGFKLLNLNGGKNRFVRKTTTGSENNDSGERLIRPYKGTVYNADYEDFLDLDQQVFRECGKNEGFDKAPWIVLIVLTRSRQSILCYATLIHPRAAVTAADCVQGCSGNY
ncbi:unnamed protein product, partial [Leptidea sinapis]